jgi:hypothetical protein
VTAKRGTSHKNYKTHKYNLKSWVEGGGWGGLLTYCIQVTQYIHIYTADTIPYKFILCKTNCLKVKSFQTLKIYEPSKRNVCVIIFLMP